MKQWPNVVWVSSSDLEESLFKDCDEAAVDYVADRHGAAELDLSGRVYRVEKTLAGPNLVTRTDFILKVKRTAKTVRRKLKNISLLQGGLDVLKGRLCPHLIQ